MRICVITECELARSHGTGAQLLQLLGSDTDFHHFYWAVGHGFRSETPHSSLLADRRLPIPKVRGAIRIARERAGWTWWRDDEVNAGFLHRLLVRKGLDFDVAYVVVGSEYSSRRALSMLKVIGCPYVLRVYDIMHSDDSGIDARTCPHFAELIRGAAAVLSLNDAITREVAPLGPKKVTEIFDGQPLTPQIASPPSPDGEFRLITGGRPYVDGCKVLAQAWDELLQRVPKIRLLYVGPHFSALPAELARVATDLGFVSSDTEYRSHLAGAHAAFLSGPTKLDAFGKYSFPSRTTDYLMAGLPIVACIARDSATETILRPLESDGVEFARTPDEIIAAVIDLAGSPERWRRASLNSRQFAVEKFSLQAIRPSVLAELDRAAASSDKEKVLA